MTKVPLACSKEGRKNHPIAWLLPHSRLGTFTGKLESEYSAHENKQDSSNPLASHGQYQSYRRRPLIRGRSRYGKDRSDHGAKGQAQRKGRRLQSYVAAQRREGGGRRVDDAAVYGTRHLGRIHRDERKGYDDGGYRSFRRRSKSGNVHGTRQRFERNCAAQPFLLRSSESLFHAHRRRRNGRAARRRGAQSLRQDQRNPRGQSAAERFFR